MALPALSRNFTACVPGACLSHMPLSRPRQAEETDRTIQQQLYKGIAPQWTQSACPRIPGTQNDAQTLRQQSPHRRCKSRLYLAIGSWEIRLAADSKIRQWASPITGIHCVLSAQSLDTLDRRDSKTAAPVGTGIESAVFRQPAGTVTNYALRHDTRSLLCRHAWKACINPSSASGFGS